MNAIKVLGTGCPTCQRLLKDVESLVQEKAWQVEVEYVTDIQEILSYGIMSTPALVVGNAVVTNGHPGRPRLEKLLGAIFN